MANPLRAQIQSNEDAFARDGSVDVSKRHIVAVVTDDVNKALRDITPSSVEQLKQLLRTTLADVTTAKDLLALTPGTVIDLTIPPPPDPTPEQLARKTFLDAYTAYQSGFRKIQCGLLQADDAAVAELLSAAQKALTDAKKAGFDYTGLG